MEPVIVVLLTLLVTIMARYTYLQEKEIKMLFSYIETLTKVQSKVTGTMLDIDQAILENFGHADDRK